MILTWIVGGDSVAYVTGLMVFFDVSNLPPASPNPEAIVGGKREYAMGVGGFNAYRSNVEKRMEVKLTKCFVHPGQSQKYWLNKRRDNPFPASLTIYS